MAKWDKTRQDIQDEKVLQSLIGGGFIVPECGDALIAIMIFNWAIFSGCIIFFNDYHTFIVSTWKLQIASLCQTRYFGSIASL